MNIVSKYPDYYDCGVAYGIDKKIYFKREKKELGTFYSRRNFKEPTTEFFGDGAVYFCGKKYPFQVVATVKDPKKPIKREEVSLKKCDYTYYYDIEEYYFDYPHRIPTKGKFHKWQLERKSVPRENLDVVDISDEEFIKRGVPYFAETSLPNYYGTPEQEFSSESNLPILKNFKFAKAVDPMVAFQEISMYLGVINNKEQECDIAEEHRIKGHGFNCESFRTRGKEKKKC